MKKEYTKPNMEIVSFTTESIATDVTSTSNATTLTNASVYQTDFKTISY